MMLHLHLVQGHAHVGELLQLEELTFTKKKLVTWLETRFFEGLVVFNGHELLCSSPFLFLQCSHLLHISQSLSCTNCSPKKTVLSPLLELLFHEHKSPSRKITMVAKTILLASALAARTLARPHNDPHSLVGARDEKADLEAAALASWPPIIVGAVQYGGGEKKEEAAYVKLTESTTNKEAGKIFGDKAFGGSIPEKSSSSKFSEETISASAYGNYGGGFPAEKTSSNGNGHSSKLASNTSSASKEEKTSYHGGYVGESASMKGSSSKESSEKEKAYTTENPGLEDQLHTPGTEKGPIKGSKDEQDKKLEVEQEKTKEQYHGAEYSASSGEATEFKQSKGSKGQQSSESNYGQNSYGVTSDEEQFKTQNESTEQHKSGSENNYGQSSCGTSSKNEKPVASTVSKEQPKPQKDYGQYSYGATSKEEPSKEQKQALENYGQNSYGAVTGEEQFKEKHEEYQDQSAEEHKQVHYGSGKEAEECQEDSAEADKQQKGNQHKQGAQYEESDEKNHHKLEDHENHQNQQQAEETEPEGYADEASGSGNYSAVESTASTEDKAIETDEEMKPSYVQVAGSNSVSVKTTLALLVGVASAIALLS